MSEERVAITPAPALPSATLSRERQAHVEVGRTDVAPATARAMAVMFAVMIAIVPLVEWLGVNALAAQGLEPSWSHLTRLHAGIRDELAALPGAGAWDRIVRVNRRALAALSAFETALEDESLLGRTLRPPAQLALTRWLGAGNERVYKGAGGWLFYRPDVEYVTGRPFLEPRMLERRIGSASEWDRPPQPDPRPAIARFRRDLAARGITLVVMPTPVKPSIHPEALASGYGGLRGALHNPSYAPLLEDLRRDGTLVFDPAAALTQSRRFGPQYLETDTHWRPEAMEEVAELLARFVREHVPLSSASASYRIERQEITNAGDTARMLDLPEGSGLYPPETVWIRRILREDGTLWRSSRDADVLLLGDSFTNIYALESMGWGTSAGLAEQLSYALGRPVDRLVQNDEAAYATRAVLDRDPSRLDGKRVVIYQFATRELSFGDWRAPLTAPEYGSRGRRRR